MERVFTRILVVVLVILGIILSFHTFTYLNFNPTYGFLRLKQEAIATGWYLPAYYSHIFMGGIVLSAGFIQFSKKLRHKFPRLHRSIGYVYFLGILLFSAPGGMIMSFFIERGPVVFCSFLLQCSLWMFFTYLSLRKILHGEIIAHEEWITRSFALTLAAITLRLYIFVASYWFDLNNHTAYGIFSWLSWIPNLLVAELIIVRKRGFPLLAKA